MNKIIQKLFYYLSTNDKNPKQIRNMSQICRTCLSQITDLNFTNITDDSKIKTQLIFCVPEISQNLVLEPVMCTACITRLHSLYDFKHQCLCIEDRIRQKMQDTEVKAGVNLAELYFSDVIKSDMSNIKQELCSDNEAADFIKIEEHKFENTGGASASNSLDQEEEVNLLSDKNEYKVVQNPPSEKKHKCSICNFASIYRSSLNRHMSVLHDGKKYDFKFRNKTKEFLFKCHSCEYGSVCKNNLRRHMLLHEEKTLECKKCNYRTANKYNLKMHMRRHNKENLLSCMVCQYATTDRKNLKRHIMTHTGEKRFKCNDCNYKTAQKFHLRRHMMVHVKCRICDCIITRTGFRKHVLSHLLQPEFN